MRLEKADYRTAKGWYLGWWNSSLQVALGYAHAGIDEPHQHSRLTEVYLVARGTCKVRIECETLELAAGDVLVIEPGEAHTFLEYSNDYFHFVLHVPAPGEPCPQHNKTAVLRGRLDL